MRLWTDLQGLPRAGICGQWRYSRGGSTLSIQYMTLDDIDRRILSFVQEGFPLVPRPFQEIGEKLGISEDEAIARISQMQEDGSIRQIGPVIDSRQLGYRGILAAIAVPNDRLDEVGARINSYREVSHNYLRPSDSGYNMWFTLSAPEERAAAILEEISGLELPLMVLSTRHLFKIGVKFDFL